MTNERRLQIANIASVENIVMRPSLFSRAQLVAIVAVCSAVASASLSASEPTFEADVRPIFRAYCFDCHGATDEKEGGLDLRQVKLQQAGGDSGPAIVPGDPEASLLIARMRAGEMPPHGAAR